MNPYFLEVFEGMERLSPGSQGTTLFTSKSISRKEELNILEIGGGLGTTALLLAKVFPKARIISIDNNKDYVRQLNQKASQAGVSQQVQGMIMSMDQLQFPTGQFDVIWAEGSVYLTGLEKALKDWKKYLAPTGQMIINDLCWTRPHVPRECHKYWVENYPEMSSVAENKKKMEQAGYDVKNVMPQHSSDWTEHYYHPIQENLRKMAEKYGDKPEVQEVIEHFTKEMTMYYKYSSYYSYVVYVLEQTNLLGE